VTFDTRIQARLTLKSRQPWNYEICIVLGHSKKVAADCFFVFAKNPGAEIFYNLPKLGNGQNSTAYY
jgi:hypothetical protein